MIVRIARRAESSEVAFRFNLGKLTLKIFNSLQLLANKLRTYAIKLVWEPPPSGLQTDDRIIQSNAHRASILGFRVRARRSARAVANANRLDE